MKENVSEKVTQFLKKDHTESVSVLDNKVETLQISLNIQEIENMFTMEEENYVMKLHKLFYETWQGISLGEKVLNDTVKFCQDRSRHPLSKEYCQAVDMANK